MAHKLVRLNRSNRWSKPELYVDRNRALISPKIDLERAPRVYVTVPAPDNVPEAVLKYLE